MAARRKRRQKQQEKDASFAPPPALEKKDSIASMGKTDFELTAQYLILHDLIDF